jgi:DtxR family Mn-dependent transcriptional regulator
MTTTQPVAACCALTPRAGDVLRRYVLVELFLVRVLDLAPADAPAEADRLEHAVSERLLTRIDALLGWPERDLRGEHIPRQEAMP